MKKRALTLFLALVMCLSTCIPAFGDSANMSTAGQKAYLAGVCGIPTEFLDSVTEDIILDMYEDSVGKCVTVSSYEVKYGVMEPSSAISPMSIPSSDFKMTTLVTKVLNSSGTEFLYYSVYTNYEWLDKEPSYRLSKDGITVNWDNNYLYYKANSFYAKSYYKTATSSWIQYDYITSPDKAEQGGVGVSFDLHNDYATWLKGTVYLRVGTDSFGSGRTTTINSNYAHTCVPLTSTFGFNISGVNVGFSSTSGRELCASSTNVTLS